MEFLIIAYDGTDSEAKARRLKAREAHLAGAKAMVEAGKFINGGAILGENGEMIGSTLIMDFETREELDQWIANDPYTTGGVWVDVEIKPIRLAFRQ
jgi:uncharacterized protein YciI